jgi:hypothetical protein
VSTGAGCTCPAKLRNAAERRRRRLYQTAQRRSQVAQTGSLAARLPARTSDCRPTLRPNTSLVDVVLVDRAPLGAPRSASIRWRCRGRLPRRSASPLSPLLGWSQPAHRAAEPACCQMPMMPSCTWSNAEDRCEASATADSGQHEQPTRGPSSTPDKDPRRRHEISEQGGYGTLA